jgi:hypothetical protein
MAFVDPLTLPNPPRHAPFAKCNCVRVVGSFEELVSTPFAGKVNALCWSRTLEGDFGEIVSALDVKTGISTITEERLDSLPLTAAGRIARETILKDLERLRALDLAPALDCVNGYEHDLNAGPVPTHVQSFHVDSATVPADTYLCTYAGRPSEGLPNEQAMRRVDIPETRAELLDIYGGPDDEDFREYLNENFFDLHYAPLPTARPFQFGVGNLWRIACEHAGSPVAPCIHRAPDTVPGESARLLLIS